jgi:type II secretory pathway pseudopilin PulG
MQAMATIRRTRLAFSLLESVIALFLLSFAALSVLSMTQTGFQSQRRSQEAARANLAAQSVAADIRLWAENIVNYKSGWAPYNGPISQPDFPDYTITVRSLAAGRPIYSPCSEIESQWLPAANPVTDRGPRMMPNAIVPVEIVVAWSPSDLDRVTVITYVGEPKRVLPVAPAVPDWVYGGPTVYSMGVGATTEYTIAVRDPAGIPLDNVFWQWVPDPSFLVPTADCPRDGRRFEMERLPNPGPPSAPPPTPPKVSVVTCYLKYAGQYYDAQVSGVELP